ncbi:hypothetical protein QN277_002194 [Acacia crassicarpa]|uniref:Uncharacterized protein n=1 Tax=Acacia crassicarpa TaxID=499986 RepID=A0AAE1N8P0_9FABA|nr:hypothetical protein QN277_002194 [Acacia crassicarpa]
MDTIAASVLEGLTSLALEEFKLLRNAKDDVEMMKNTVGAIRATLLDAEAEANNNHQVSFWLARLKDVLYDADDVLDDLSTEALRKGTMTQNKVAKKVRIFFSESNQVVYNIKMAHKLREVRGTLDKIEKDRKEFNFTDQPLKPFFVLEGRKQTYSLVQGDEIIGRGNEKNVILRYFFDSNVKSSVSIIPIVGFGGLGKTALAQLVYNDKHVQEYFELRKWVCVSDECDVRQIAQKLLGQDNTKEMEEVQQDLRQLIEGKKFLIVLDDVWNENDDFWNSLKRLLSQGAEGSMVVVTTRSHKVGKMKDTHKPIILEGLDGKRSWELFCRRAFKRGEESNDKELLAIGREVVRKCAGVPLAIIVVGSLVSEKASEGIDLSYLKNCELWNVDKKVEERVFAVLKLSYDHLPSPIKNCVAFCSLFPKDFLFKRQTLIQMWIAEGFIPSTNQRCEEDVGHEYFVNLLSRSFFQDVTRDGADNIETCKMHDLIHDLALSVAKHEYLVIKEGKEDGSKETTTRHLSYDVPRKKWKVPTSFLKFEKLRTMLLLNDIFCQMDHSVFDLVASKLKCLRVLDLHKAHITEIPESIGKLKHLRFLDLSWNGIRQVSRAITRLQNLQTLNLSSNYDLRELPSDISKLVSLRHLHLTKCDRLEWMPSGLGQLTSLQTLTHFVVDDGKTHWRRVVDEGKTHWRRVSARINELGELNNLRGSLTIKELKHLRSNPKEAESARLQDKQHLQQLSLDWGTFDNKYDEFSKVDSDELILERLCPHHTIKVLLIKRFCGESLPGWIGNLLQLRRLELSDCHSLKSLPEGLRNLTSLRRLTISGSPLLSRDEWQKTVHVPFVDSSM